MVYCRCPICNTKGERLAAGSYTWEDNTFTCSNCGYNGGEGSLKLIVGDKTK